MENTQVLRENKNGNRNANRDIELQKELEQAYAEEERRKQEIKDNQILPPNNEAENIMEIMNQTGKIINGNG